MIITLNSFIRIEDISEELLQWVEENLIVDNPLYLTMKKMGKEDTIRYRHIPPKMKLYAKNRGIFELPMGCLKLIWPMIKNSEIILFFNDSGDISCINDKPIFDLYDYQESAVTAMKKAKSGVLVSPAGSGKTFMGIELMHRIGKKTLWLCHTGDLLRQAKDDMLSMYPNLKIGLTTQGNIEIGEDVTIATVQTMSKLDSEYYWDKFDVVICDECAHVAGSPDELKMFIKVLSNINARYKYGLTATPSRSDGMIKAMYAYIGCSTNGFEPTYKVDRSNVKTIEALHKRVELYSHYDEEAMMELYDSSGMMNYTTLINKLSENEIRTNKIIDNIINCDKEKRKQVVLCLRVEHCKEIVKKLKDKGIKAELCTGSVKNKDRDAILKQEVDWNVIVATYQLLKEGVSIKELDTLHLVVPVKDKATVVQCAGRIERYLENKKQPIIYDYVDTDIPYCEKVYTERRRALKRRF